MSNYQTVSEDMSPIQMNWLKCLLVLNCFTADCFFRFDFDIHSLFKCECSLTYVFSNRNCTQQQHHANRTNKLRIRYRYFNGFYFCLRIFHHLVEYRLDFFLLFHSKALEIKCYCGKIVYVCFINLVIKRIKQLFVQRLCDLEWNEKWSFHTLNRCEESSKFWAE